MDTLYLASASPRRAELLRQAGLSPVVLPSQAPERRRSGESAPALVLRLARLKALATAKVLAVRGAREGMVLGADTVVEARGRILGKPKGAAEARAMLKALAGRAHRVHTGVCLIRLGAPTREAESFVETTKVFFRNLSEQEISEYVATGEPLDKAGAYGIQGAAGAFVRRIEGDYYSVVGLPLSRVVESLRRLDAERAPVLSRKASLARAARPIRMAA